MDHPFDKSIPTAERCRRLFQVVGSDDTLAIIIVADPDAMASAVALKRLFWRRAAKVSIYHCNAIRRADNLAFIKLLKIEQMHVRDLRRSEITKWAVVDSQPSHMDAFRDMPFDIVIDHHPLVPATKARFMDVREDYGANASIMTEYLRAARIKPSRRLATALFYGIKTDTGDFTRGSLFKDIEAFRYLYPIANLNTIKKIESSEMSRGTLASFREAFDRLTFSKDTAFVHMGEVKSADLLVIIADFFLKLAEAKWSVVSGIYGGKLIVIFRNAGLHGDAGKKAARMFSRFGGSGGGHKTAARAEVPLEAVPSEIRHPSEIQKFVARLLKETAQGRGAGTRTVHHAKGVKPPETSARR
jgi:nanoRNase/pAp phosphatase (c-di-AMP/oligoRNAs hydrolase)